MRRREFIAALGVAAWPLAVRAQRFDSPKVGVLVTVDLEPFWSEFRAGLRERGYVEGQNIVFEFRSADGKPERLRGLADELVHLKADIIVACQTPAVVAARQATSDIPIVMAPADPVGTGLISSLAHPGGNITGLSATSAETGAKTLELIREIMPSTQRVGVLANAADPFSRVLAEFIENGGDALGVTVKTIRVRGVKEEIEAAFAAMVDAGANAVIVQGSLPHELAIDLALKHRLPLIGANPFAREGGLISYSSNQNETFHRAAFYVDRILKGAKPAELPVEQPTHFKLAVNLKTAKTLGLTVPPSLLARAEEVIE